MTYLREKDSLGFSGALNDQSLFTYCVPDNLPLKPFIPHPYLRTGKHIKLNVNSCCTENEH